MMDHTNYYWGMNMIWWVAWVVMLMWIFATPYDIPGQRSKKNTAMDILRKRYASGKINGVEYDEKRKILEQK